MSRMQETLNALLPYVKPHSGQEIHFVHGFVTAVVAGPVEIDEDEWMPHLADFSQPFTERDEEAMMLLSGFYDLLHDRITDYALEIPFEAGDQPAFSGWKDGFLAGKKLHAEQWLPDIDSDLMKLMQRVPANEEEMDNFSEAVCDLALDFYSLATEDEDDDD